MSTHAIRSIATVMALTALAGCSVDDGYELPSVSGGGGGVAYVPYAPYGPGYYGYGRGPVPYGGYPGYYDPRYGGAGAYSPYGYQGGYYPYGGYYGPYPRYVVVPCVDNNRDGRCDKHGGNHDPHTGDGNGNGGHHDGGDGSGDGNHHHNAGNGAGGNTAPPAYPYVRPRETAPRPATVRPQQQVQPKAVEPAPSPGDDTPRNRKNPRADKVQPQQP